MKILAYLVKFTVIYLIMRYGLSHFKGNNSWPDIVLFFLIYIPLFMGYEDIITITLKHFVKNDTTEPDGEV